jgi:hypothetical protein
MEGQMLNSIEESGLDDVSIRYLQAEVKNAMGHPQDEVWRGI